MSFLRICETIKDAEWNDSLDHNITTYVCNMVEKDWEFFNIGLKEKG